MTLLSRRSPFAAAFAVTLAFAAFAAGQTSSWGRPNHERAGGAEHYALWRDYGGWHLRIMMKRESDYHFEGEVSVRGGALEEVRPARPERADQWKSDEKKLTFSFAGKGGEDGVDWKIRGDDARLAFKLHMGRQEPRFAPDRILVGKEGESPTRDGFELPAVEPK